MIANPELNRVRNGGGLSGFTNLFRNENRAWWRTPRWWIHALLWTGVLGGLTAFILFGSTNYAFLEEGEQVRFVNPGEVVRGISGLAPFVIVYALAAVHLACCLLASWPVFQ